MGLAELSYVPADVTQSEDRAHRIGQRDSVQVQHLVFDGSLDSIMAKMLIAKQKIADKALDIEPEKLEKPSLEQEFKIDLPQKPKHAPAPEYLRVLVHQGLRILAGVCDGASQRDDSGFNRFDSVLGKELAARDRLTDGQVWLAKKMLRKYSRQLPEEITNACASQQTSG